ncbi:membrane protein [Chryseobacterium angstadtii]|uniref:Membrane protein n=2 Tax=Chryseobacterium angstadtii TaxID=558151 RepID=A0A0J7IKW6_9FLAO|nr:membrane protein [Chryseobacterium angstadtii]
MTQKQKTLAIYALPLVLLCIPLLGNILSDEVNWSASDFLIAGILLFSMAFLINLVRTRIKTQSRRILICIFILIALALIWIELAVGIFGTPFAGN